MKELSHLRCGLERVPASGSTDAAVADLSSDYSTFTVPKPVADAIVWAARSTDLGRHNTAGGRYLRHAIIDKLRVANCLEASDDGIIVTAGATSGACYVIGALCDAGDQILVPDPGPDVYIRLAASWGVKAVRYPTDLAGTPDWEALEDLVEHETKAIVINSPGDPAGNILTHEQLVQYLDFARANDLYVISDQQSDLLAFDDADVPCAARLDHDGRVLTIYSLARTHAMAGLRLGYVVAAPPLADAVGRAQDSQLAGPSTLALAAGLAAFTMDASVVESMVASYQQMRDLVEANLPEEMLPAQAKAGYFMLVDITDTHYPDGHAFASALLQQAGVKVAPGPRFGQQTAKMIRLTLAVTERTLSRGIEQLLTFLTDL